MKGFDDFKSKLAMNNQNFQSIIVETIKNNLSKEDFAYIPEEVAVKHYMAVQQLAMKTTECYLQMYHQWLSEQLH
jgi:hypothetical protein